MSNLSLESLEEWQELIQDRIDILKGEECINNNQLYSEKEAHNFIQKCLKE